MPTERPQLIWQPVMLMITHRLDCGVCGAKAIFVVLDDPEKPSDDKEDWGYTAWCQPCWHKACEDADD